MLLLTDQCLSQYDSDRPHRARVVREFMKAEAIETLLWLVMLPEMIPIEHL